MISVVIPVYNAEPYLSRCLDSVLNSTHQDFELILVNDGSTDNSPAICEDYAARDSRVTLISQENSGASAARNRGLEVCRGEWVVFVDADDLISPDFLEIVAWEEHQNQDLLLFDFARTEEELTAPHPAPKTQRFGAKDVPELLRCHLLRRQLIEDGNLNFVSPCGKAYRKAVIEQYAIRFDPQISYGEDQVFNVEYLTKIKLSTYLSAPVYYYNINPGSSSHRIDADLIHSFEKMSTAVESVLKASGFLPLLEDNFISNTQENLAYLLHGLVFSPLNSSPFSQKCQICQEMRNSDVFLRASKCRPLSGTWYYRFVKRVLFFMFRTRQYWAISISALCSHVWLMLKNPKKLKIRRKNRWFP